MRAQRRGGPIVVINRRRLYAPCPRGVWIEYQLQYIIQSFAVSRAVRRALLEAEGVEFLGDGRVDLDRYLWIPTELSDSTANTATGE